VHPIHSIGPKTHVLGCFGPFRYCTKVDAKLAEQLILTHKFSKRSCVVSFRNERTRSTPLLNEVALELFTTSAPNPFHSTQNSCFGAFRTVSLLLESRCRMAELAPLTHKFAKRICVGIFHNECTRSTPLVPKLMFWDVSDHFVAAQKSMQNLPNRCH
jgi:hypothetical protein